MKLPILVILAIVVSAQCMEFKSVTVSNKTGIKLLKSEQDYINPEHDTGVDQMLNAIVQGNVKQLKKVLAQNPNQSVNIRVTMEGQYPIHLAALQIRNGTEIIAILLDRNSDIDCIDNEGKTPLATAAAANNTRAITLLLKKGARRFWDNDQENPYYHALRGGSIEAIKLLIGFNISVGKHEIELADSAIAFFNNKSTISFYHLLNTNAKLAKSLFNAEIKKQKKAKKSVQKNGYVEFDEKKFYFPWYRKIKRP